MISLQIADYYVDSFCHGIYASAAKELSVATCFPSFVKYEKEFGSLVLGYFFSKDGKHSFSVFLHSYLLTCQDFAQQEAEEDLILDNQT